jgi:hypothetical protein
MERMTSFPLWSRFLESTLPAVVSTWGEVVAPVGGRVEVVVTVTDATTRSWRRVVDLDGPDGGVPALKAALVLLCAKAGDPFAGELAISAGAVDLWSGAVRISRAAPSAAVRVAKERTLRAKLRADREATRQMIEMHEAAAETILASATALREARQMNVAGPQGAPKREASGIEDVLQTLLEGVAGFVGRQREEPASTWNPDFREREEQACVFDAWADLAAPATRPEDCQAKKPS